MSQLADALLRKMIADHSYGHKQLQKKHSHKHKATKPQLDTLASTSKHPQVTVEEIPDEEKGGVSCSSLMMSIESLVQKVSLGIIG